MVRRSSAGARGQLKTLSVTEVARNFSAVVDSLEREQEEIVLIRNRRRVARLIPEPPQQSALNGLLGFVAGRHRSGRAPTLCLPFEPGPHDLRKIDNAWWADPDLAALATDARLGEIATALLGASSVRLWQDQLLYKPPGGPSETTIGWHQDWASWDTVASHAAFVTAWVAFDDADDDNGAMQIIPASHTWGLVPGASNFFGTDRDAQLARLGDGRVVESRSIVIRAGQVSFHHPLTFHGSGPNTSHRMRRSLAIHFVDAEVSAVSEPGIWQHYNLALFLERGGRLGERYRFDDLCPTVFAQ